MGALAPAAAAPAGVHEAGEWLVAADRWAGWLAVIRAAVDRHAREVPLDPGLPLEAARRAADLPDARVLEAVLAGAPDLVSDAGRVRRPDAVPTFPPAVRRALDDVRARLRERPFYAPDQPELDALGLRPPLLAAAAKAGLLLRLAGEVVLLPEAEDEAVRRLAELPAPFTASAARQALDTTRRVAIPLLEHLDARGRTRRVDASARVVVR